MNRAGLLRFLLVAGLFPSAGWAVDGWGQLKAGMSRSETTAVLGTELVASRGRGFEVAVYDGRAEVVYLNGQLVAWTAPLSSEAAPAPVDAWQFDQVARARARAASGNRSGTPGAAVRQRSILPSYRW